MPERPTKEHAVKMGGIHRKLRWIATLVPLALLAMVAVDGISWTDVEIVAFVAVILGLFVFLTGSSQMHGTASPPSDQ